MKNILIIFLLLFTFGLTAQQPYQKGVIIDSVPVNGSDVEQFALYLPKTMKAGEKAPIVFLFDPQAQGKTAIAPFISSAESHGLIVVCANHIRNGPYEQNFAKAERLFAHVLSNFSIAENQIYLAGFSGGSRLATAIAVLTDQMAGVIACGAGFSQHPMHGPSDQHFSYIGVCGTRDVNLTEMFGVVSYLDTIDFDHTLLTFEGGHRWPPSEVLHRAFDWLVIRNQDKTGGTLPKTFLETAYSRAQEGIRTAAKSGLLLQQANAYEHTIATFGPFFQTDSIADAMGVLKASKGYKSQKKARKTALAKETQLVSTISDRFYQDYQKPEKARLSWWQKQLDNLNAEALRNTEMERMADRIKNRIYIMTIERARAENPKPSEAQIKLCNNINRLVYAE